MELPGRASAAAYRQLGERWRRLAAEATTAGARNHLLSLARQCEFLARPGVASAPAVPDSEESETLDASQ